MSSYPNLHNLLSDLLNVYRTHKTNIHKFLINYLFILLLLYFILKSLSIFFLCMYNYTLYTSYAVHGSFDYANEFFVTLSQRCIDS
jgi:hypothetical protein